MSALFRHPIRVVGRLLWLMAEFALAALHFALCCGRNASITQRARWLQHTARRMLRILRPTVRVSGSVPASGLLVSNHLSYIDILVIASVTPAIFVAKHEVAGWPVFSWFAKMGGTLFVDREHRATVGQTTDEIQSALDRGALVVLFPEGTSSNGQTVLPFKSSLLEPATRQTQALFVGVIQYEIEDGNVAEEICYWKDMKMLPHALNLLSKRSIRASVRFTQLREGSTDRKELARQLHSEVLRLKESAVFDLPR
jgi:1-acyl-sn-glycerol-3-phosphate acyltransferase